MQYLSIRQAALEFNINYRALSHYCKKIPEYDLGTILECVTINSEYGINYHIFTISFKIK